MYLKNLHASLSTAVKCVKQIPRSTIRLRKHCLYLHIHEKATQRIMNWQTIESLAHIWGRFLTNASTKSVDGKSLVEARNEHKHNSRIGSNYPHVLFTFEVGKTKHALSHQLMVGGWGVVGVLGVGVDG